MAVEGGPTKCAEKQEFEARMLKFSDALLKVVESQTRIERLSNELQKTEAIVNNVEKRLESSHEESTKTLAKLE